MTAPRLDRSVASGRPTWAEVSLPVLRANFAAVRKHVGRDVTVCAVVKADAYGHGAVECARALEAAGAAWIGVTGSDEGLALRRARIKARILLMTGIGQGEEQEVAVNHLTPMVWDLRQIQLLESAARVQHISLPIHLKIDTGMARLGAAQAELPTLCDALAANQHLRLEGVSTHFASGETLDADDAERQRKCFEQCLAILEKRGFRPPLVHMANSAAIAARPETRKTMVRPGIVLYGYSLPITRKGKAADVKPLPLRTVLSWKTRVISVKEIAAGQGVGYGATFVARERGRIAVLSVGYADGFRRMLSNRGRVIVRGEYAPVAGRVSMDLTTIDVSGISGVEVGDEVVLIGESGGKSIDAWEHARICQTIPYEILCGIGKRVPRVYVGG